MLKTIIKNLEKENLLEVSKKTKISYTTLWRVVDLGYASNTTIDKLIKCGYGDNYQPEGINKALAYIDSLPEKTLIMCQEIGDIKNILLGR